MKRVTYPCWSCYALGLEVGGFILLSFEVWLPGMIMLALAILSLVADVEGW
jgi:hypothetical protein